MIYAGVAQKFGEGEGVMTRSSPRRQGGRAESDRAAVKYLTVAGLSPAPCSLTAST